MISSNNKTLLIVIAVVLVGVFAVMLLRDNQRTQGDRIGESIGDVIDSAGDGAQEFGEEVADEIDDNTDSQ